MTAATANAPAPRVEVITDFARLQALAAPWGQLAEACAAADFFLLPEWSLRWWEEFGAGRELRVLAAWDGDELVGLAPLYARRTFLWRVLTFLGHPRLADRMDFPCAPGREAACCRAFLDTLAARRDWDGLLLREFAPFTADDRLLADLAGERRLRTYAAPDSPCLYVPLGRYDGYEAYFQAINTRDARSKLRRKFKKLAADGGTFATVTAPGAELIREIAVLDAERSPRGDEGRCFFGQAANRDFILRLCADPELAPRIVVHTIRFGEALAAYALVFVHRGRAGCYQINFDKAYHAHSPASLLFFYAIEQAYAAGLEEFDFLKGDEGYKSHFTEEARVNKRLFVYSGSLASRLLAFYHARLKPLRRRLAGSSLAARIPAGLRARLDV